MRRVCRRPRSKFVTQDFDGGVLSERSNDPSIHAQVETCTLVKQDRPSQRETNGRTDRQGVFTRK